MLLDGHLQSPNTCRLYLHSSIFVKRKNLPESRHHVLLLIIKTWVAFGWASNWTGSENVPTTVTEVEVNSPTLASWNGFLLGKRGLCQEKREGALNG